MKRSTVAVVAAIVCSAVLSIAGCGGNSSVTKDEWKARVQKNFPGFMRMVEYPDKATFISVMGKPDRTQTVGGNPYWYYQCADGMIQIQFCAVPGKENMLVLSAMNDY